jgi:hypothetical protein
MESIQEVLQPNLQDPTIEYAEPAEPVSPPPTQNGSQPAPPVNQTGMQPPPPLLAEGEEPPPPPMDGTPLPNVWIYEGEAYDLTEFIKKHPGGEFFIGRTKILRR